MNNFTVTQITAFASILAIIVSATQIYITHIDNTNELSITTIQKEKELIQKTKELQLKTLEIERNWHFKSIDFVSKHMDKIFSNNIEESTRIKNVMEASFPPQINQALFKKIGKASSSKSTRNIWERAYEDMVRHKSLIIDELLYPVTISLKKTNDAYKRWKETKKFIEIKSIYEGNLTTSTILTTKNLLIPPELRVASLQLQEHYDDWIAGYQRIIENNQPSDNRKYTIKYSHLPFPKSASALFSEILKQYKEDVAALRPVIPGTKYHLK